MPVFYLCETAIKRPFSHTQTHPHGAGSWALYSALTLWPQLPHRTLLSAVILTVLPVSSTCITSSLYSLSSATLLAFVQPRQKCALRKMPAIPQLGRFSDFALPTGQRDGCPRYAPLFFGFPGREPGRAKLWMHVGDCLIGLTVDQKAG